MSFEEAFSAARSHHARGDLTRAIDAYRHALELDPARPEAWHLKGIAEHQSGLLDQALESARRAIAEGGDRAPFVLFEGDVLHDRGDLEGAETRFARLAAAAPGWIPAQLALGRVRMDRGAFLAAAEAFRAVVAADASHARAWNNLGVALERLGDLDASLAAFEKAASLDPGYALARLNLARALDGRETERALEHVEAAVRLEPRLAEGWLILSDIHRRRFALAHALSALDSGLRFAPEDPRLAAARAEVLSHLGRVPESRNAFRAILAAHPESFKAALGAHLTLPRVHESAAHLEEARHDYAEGLERLHEAAEEFRFASPEAALADARWVNFYLAYQGRDDRLLQARYGELLDKVLRPRLPQFFAERARRAARERIRVGFFSHFFFNCVVGRYFASWITDLDPREFEVLVYYTNETLAEDTKRIAAAAARFRHLSGRPLPAIAHEMIADELDVLVFPELGMHPETFALASLRLAPAQCVAWGHPTTTGLAEIDWFLSCASMEPPEGEAHYTERLALLPGLGTRYAIPKADAGGARKDFGIPDDRTAYLVPQSLFKIHPDNDDLIARVLEADPDGVAVLFPSSREEYTRTFRTRLDGVLARRSVDSSRVRFLEFVPHARYLRINQLCDVMLDTLHWSGGNTSLDALASGLPVVTLPGSLMRGRQSAAMLEAVGVPELVVHDVDAYVETAVRLGRGRDEREEVARRIAGGRDSLFERPEPVRALEEFLRGVAQGR